MALVFRGLTGLEGYKERKHIAKALQSRLHAIWTAIDWYNAAAPKASPPRSTLKWDQVIEYTFLAEFDILRDACQSIWSKPWATPTGCHALDKYFRMKCAQEEIMRLNVEIACLACHLHERWEGVSFIYGGGAIKGQPPDCISSTTALYHLHASTTHIAIALRGWARWMDFVGVSRWGNAKAVTWGSISPFCLKEMHLMMW